MSIKIMTIVWDAKTGLTAAQKMVLLKLADHSDDFGICWPSQTTIANQCEANRATVNRAIKKLEELHFIEKCNKYRGNIQIVNVYRINIPLLQKVTPAAVAESHTPMLQDVTPGVAGCHTEPSLNHQLEPPLSGERAKEPDYPADAETEGYINVIEKLPEPPAPKPLTIDRSASFTLHFVPFLEAKTAGAWVSEQNGWMGRWGQLKAQTNCNLSEVFEWAKDNYLGGIGGARFFGKDVWPKIFNAYQNRGKSNSGYQKPPANPKHFEKSDYTKDVPDQGYDNV